MNIAFLIGIILLTIGLVKLIGYLWAGVVFIVIAIWAQLS